MAKKKKPSDAILKQLRDLAQNDWDKFAELAGIDLSKAAICLQKSKGKSVRAIAQQTGISKSTVERTCKICPENADGTPGTDI